MSLHCFIGRLRIPESSERVIHVRFRILEFIRHIHIIPSIKGAARLNLTPDERSGMYGACEVIRIVEAHSHDIAFIAESRIAYTLLFISFDRSAPNYLGSIARVWIKWIAA